MKNIAILFLFSVLPSETLKADDPRARVVQISNLGLRSLQLLSPEEIELRLISLSEITLLDDDFKYYNEYSLEKAKLGSYLIGFSGGSVSLMIFGLSISSSGMLAVMGASAVISAAIFPEYARTSAIGGGLGSLSSYVLYGTSLFVRALIGIAF